MKTKTRTRRCKSRWVYRLSARNGALYRWYLRNNYWPEFGSAGHFASEFSKTAGDVVFIQVGTCMEVENDPIIRIAVRDGWRGVVIETDGEKFAEFTEPLYRNMSGINVLKVPAENKKWMDLLSETALTGGLASPAWLQINSHAREIFDSGIPGGEVVNPVVIVADTGSTAPGSVSKIRETLSGKGYTSKQLGRYLLAVRNPDDFLSRFVSEG